MNPRTVARGKILIAALLFSTGGAAIKASTLSAWQVASLRSGIAGLTLLVLLPAARRSWRMPSFVVAFAYAATMILYVSANKLTTAANTIFLQSTAPLFVLLLSPWLLKERIHRRDLLHMLVLAAGMTLFFVGVDAPMGTAPDPLRGNVFAALSGVAWALTILGLRWTGKAAGGGAASAAALGNLLAFAFAFPRALPLVGMTPSDLGILVYLGVFQVGLAYVFLVGAVKELPALETALLLLLEPVLNPIWAWMVHGETPGGWSLVGGAVILVASVVRALQRPRAATPPATSGSGGSDPGRSDPLPGAPRRDGRG